MCGEVFLLLYLDKEKPDFAEMNACPTLIQVIDGRFFFFNFLKNSIFVIDRLFVWARKTNLNLNVRRSGVGAKLNVTKCQV